MAKEEKEYACLKKRPYQSRREAKKIAKIVWNKKKIRLRVYMCNHCDLWFLTSDLTPNRTRAKLINLNMAPSAINRQK